MTIFGFIGNLGFTEILLILVVALLIFGPAKLPEIGKSMGRSINEFKKSMNADSDKNSESNETKKDHEA